MFCTSCGNSLKEDDRFCAKCGKGVAGENTGPAFEASDAGPRPRLMRAMKEKKVAGVCAGIARHMGWDVTLVRIAFLLGVVVNGVGLLAYLIAWIVMPRDDQQVVVAR